MDNPKRARSWKRRTQPRVDLKIVEPILYSTFFRFSIGSFSKPENPRFFGKFPSTCFPDDCS